MDRERLCGSGDVCPFEIHGFLLPQTSLQQQIEDEQVVGLG
jgi:hypothetical protein